MIVGCNKCRDRDTNSEAEPCYSCIITGRAVPTNWRKAITQDAAYALLATCESLLTLVVPVDCSATNMVAKAREAIADVKGAPDAKGCGNCATTGCSPMLEQGCKMFELFSHWTPERGDQ